MIDKSKPYHFDEETKTLRMFFKTDAFLPPGEFAGAVINIQAPDATEAPNEEDVLRVIEDYEANNPYGVGNLYSVSQQEYEDEYADDEEDEGDA